MTYWGLLLVLLSTSVLPTFASPVTASCISISGCGPPVVKQFSFLFPNSHISRRLYGHDPRVVVTAGSRVKAPYLFYRLQYPSKFTIRITRCWWFSRFCSPLCPLPSQSYDAHEPCWSLRHLPGPSLVITAWQASSCRVVALHLSPSVVFATFACS